jgi:hypothetical protein
MVEVSYMGDGDRGNRSRSRPLLEEEYLNCKRHFFRGGDIHRCKIWDNKGLLELKVINLAFAT